VFFFGKYVRSAAKTMVVDRKYRKALALPCLMSEPLPNAANSSDVLRFDVTRQGGLAATFDLAAFGLYVIAPVKKSVNHSKTLTSMREAQRSLARTTREFVFSCSW